MSEHQHMGTATTLDIEEGNVEASPSPWGAGTGVIAPRAPGRDSRLAGPARMGLAVDKTIGTVIMTRLCDYLLQYLYIYILIILQ